MGLSLLHAKLEVSLLQKIQSQLTFMFACLDARRVGCACRHLGFALAVHAACVAC